MRANVATTPAPSATQRHALFYGTALPRAERSKCSLTFEALVEHRVQSANVRAARIGPLTLKEWGAREASDLLALGFDAIDLRSATFAHEASSAYGSKAVVDAFVASARDAIGLAGTASARALGLQPERLLRACAGSPSDAFEVLAQLPKSALQGVPPRVLLDAGLRAPGLAECGFSRAAVVAQTNATPEEMRKLGY